VGVCSYELMANQAAKKQKQKNDKTIRNTQIGYAISFGLYILLRIIYQWDSFSIWFMMGFSLIGFTSWFCYTSILAMAKCSFDSNGELTYGGSDLAMSGLCEYYFDITYINWFVLIGTLYSNWFWFAWLLIPSFAFYKLWDLVLKPFIFAPPQTNIVEDEATRKKREKAERKANKPKFIKIKR